MFKNRVVLAFAVTVVLLGTIAAQAAPRAAAVDCTGPSPGRPAVVDGSAPARYIHSDTKTFTRDIAELVPGHRIENGPAVCWLGYQGGIHCEIDDHSFTTNGAGATLT